MEIHWSLSLASSVLRTVFRFDLLATFSFALAPEICTLCCTIVDWVHVLCGDYWRNVFSQKLGGGELSLQSAAQHKPLFCLHAIPYTWRNFHPVSLQGFLLSSVLSSNQGLGPCYHSCGDRQEIRRTIKKAIDYLPEIWVVSYFYILQKILKSQCSLNS